MSNIEVVGDASLAEKVIVLAQVASQYVPLSLSDSLSETMIL